jgi:hypothetical protein
VTTLPPFLPFAISSSIIFVIKFLVIVATSISLSLVDVDDVDDDVDDDDNINNDDNEFDNRFDNDNDDVILSFIYLELIKKLLVLTIIAITIIDINNIIIIIIFNNY